MEFIYSEHLPIPDEWYVLTRLFPGQNLSRAEEEKRRVRRERNKVAATKCREKRKAHSGYVRHEYSKVTFSAFLIFPAFL